MMAVKLPFPLFLLSCFLLHLCASTSVSKEKIIVITFYLEKRVSEYVVRIHFSV